MSKLRLLAGAMILAAGVPAAAQHDQQYGYSYGGIHDRIQNLEQRFQRGLQTGRITRAEAGIIRQELRALRDLERRFRPGGLTRWEQDELRRRADLLRDRIRTAMQGGGYRDRPYDDEWNDWSDDRWDGDDRYRDRWEDDRERWDERRDEGPWDDNYGQGGWYPVPERYRYQYRDTDRYYYRYRDGYIYQLDRRTGRAINTFWVGR